MRLRALYIVIFVSIFTACNVHYSFSGINVSKDIKTFQINYIQNNADYIVPGLSEDFRDKIIDRINKQTSLTEASSNGDLVYDCEITEYEVRPISLTSQQTAAQNRLTMKVKVNYTNTKKEADNFKKVYSFDYDFPQNKTREEIQEDAHDYLFEKIIDALFNDTLAKW